MNLLSIRPRIEDSPTNFTQIITISQLTILISTNRSNFIDLQEKKIHTVLGIASLFPTIDNGVNFALLLKSLATSKTFFSAFHGTFILRKKSPNQKGVVWSDCSIGPIGYLLDGQAPPQDLYHRFIVAGSKPLMALLPSVLAPRRCKSLAIRMVITSSLLSPVHANQLAVIRISLGPKNS